MRKNNYLARLLQIKSWLLIKVYKGYKIVYIYRNEFSKLRKEGEIKVKKTIFVVLLVILIGFIFSMSGENAEKSYNTSGQTIRVVLSIVPEFEKQPEEVKVNIIEELQFIVRKSAHFIGYMILGILASGLILHYENINKKYPLAFLICVIYAISDEIHQLFVPGRSGQVRDVLIDSAGSLLGIILVMAFVKILIKFNKKHKI